jgi:hypothetical protein
MLVVYMRGEVADHCEVTMEGISEMDSKPTGNTGQEWVMKMTGTAVQRGIGHSPKVNVVA